MNEENSFHLSAFHPFNQFNFQPSIPILHSGLSNSSLLLPQFGTQNLSLLNYIESAANNNLNSLTQNKPISRPANQLATSSAAVIVQSSSNTNNNLNLESYSATNKIHKPPLTRIKFPFVNSSNDALNNQGNNAIIQHADSSSSSELADHFEHDKSNYSLLAKQKIGLFLIEIFYKVLVYLINKKI